ncbi:hypothetical protein JCM10296v2_005463 [Rhodotorula toruloides]
MPALVDGIFCEVRPFWRWSSDARQTASGGRCREEGGGRQKAYGRHQARRPAPRLKRKHLLRLKGNSHECHAACDLYVRDDLERTSVWFDARPEPPQGQQPHYNDWMTPEVEFWLTRHETSDTKPQVFLAKGGSYFISTGKASAKQGEDPHASARQENEDGLHFVTHIRPELWARVLVTLDDVCRRGAEIPYEYMPAGRRGFALACLSTIAAEVPLKAKYQILRGYDRVREWAFEGPLPGWWVGPAMPQA